MKQTPRPEIDMRELEKQLSRPTGDTGIEVAHMMNEGNIGMTLNTIECLELANNHNVLELGHGNCGHLDRLMAKANNIHYHGLELSETMYKEAQRLNAELMSRKAIEFRLYDGKRIPYDDNTFDRIMTVNTLYFWENPESFINEIGRTLKPGGYCIITYVQKAFMQKLPFVGEIFTLYDDEDMRRLASKSNMRLVDIASKTEGLKTKSGESVERTYSMARLTK